MLHLLLPPVSNSFQIEVVACHVPLPAAYDFDTPAFEVVVEMRYRISQTIADFLFGKCIAYRPQAQLATFKASTKIGNTGIDKVLFRFMEKEEMCSPGNVPDNTDAGRPQLFISHSHLHCDGKLDGVSLQSVCRGGFRAKRGSHAKPRRLAASGAETRLGVLVHNRTRSLPRSDQWTSLVSALHLAGLGRSLP